LSSCNLQKARVVLASELNTYDVMNANKLILMESSINVIEKNF
jgi:large subunit ribosomal protein L4